MNIQAKQDPAAGWELPRSQPQAEADILGRWAMITDEIRKIAAENGWSKSEVARRADVAVGTFSSWYDGTYKGRYDTTTQRVENFIDQLRDAAAVGVQMPQAPGFLQTRVARELMTAMTYAQMLPTIAVITCASGLGKSMAARAYRNSRPHVTHVTLSPSSASPHILKQEIAQELGIDCKDGGKLKRVITDALRRSGYHALLIIDEAQNLTEDSINELRHFRDNAQCGLVLLGNEEGKTPYAARDPRHASAQVARRVGHRLSIMKPYAEDVDQIVDAWGLTDPEVRALAVKIAHMPGAFGVLAETIMIAGMIAAGHDRSITTADLRAAWENRGHGGLK